MGEDEPVGWLALVLLGFAVVLGAGTQRLTGMGFALVSGPLLVLLLGPHDGVVIVQVLGVLVCVSVLAQVWRDVEWCTAGLLLAAALVGMVPGWWVARTLAPAHLQVVVGVMIIVALLAVVASQQARVFTGRRGALAAGLVSGFMNVTAGVGGPAVVLYKESVQWAQHLFVATVQVYFLLISVATIAVRGVPRLNPTQWLVSLVALPLGLWLGSSLASRVSADKARVLVLVVAFAGALATVVKGAMAW